jgi:hypothetical protein
MNNPIYLTLVAALGSGLVAGIFFAHEARAGEGERQNAEGLRLFPHKTDGARISSRVHPWADAEADA